MALLIENSLMKLKEKVYLHEARYSQISRFRGQSFHVLRRDPKYAGAWNPALKTTLDTVY
jgi:hypothetical protein